VAWVYGDLEDELGGVVGKGYSGEERRHANRNVHIKGTGSDGSWPKEKRKKLIIYYIK
jgi:hypothetical protein